MSTHESKLIVSLLDRLTGPARAVTASMAALTAAARRNATMMSTVRSQLVDAAAVSYALARSISAPIRASVEFEEKLADIAKVADGLSPAGLKEMGQQIRELSLRIPIVADGIADIVANAAQSGIANSELMKFTEIAAKVATAWDIPASESGESLAKLKTALNRSVEDTAALADAMNYLSNKTAASSRQILDFETRVAPMASTFGMTAEQAAAIGAAMLGAGFQADVASTSFLNMGYALTAGENATKSQRVGLRKLRLEAEDVSKSMQKDAVGTLDDILGRIRELPKESQAATMQQIFGKEAKALAPLLTNANLLKETLALVADRQKYLGSAQAEFETRSKTTGNALRLFSNRLKDLSITIGDALAPGLNKALDVIGPFVTKVSKLGQQFPGVIAAVVNTAAALVGLRLAFLAARFAGLFAGAGFIAAATRALRLGAVFAKVLKFGTLFGVALTALGAAGTFIYKNWSGITTMFAQFGRSFQQAIQPIWPMLKPVTDGAQKLYDWVSKLVGPVDGLGASWFQMGHRAGKALGDALVSVTKFATDLPGKIAAIDWSRLATDLKASFDSIDFAGIWQGLVTSATTAIGTLRTTIVDGLKAIDWAAVGRSASDTVKAALESVRAAVAGFDWGSLGTTIGNAIAAAWTGLSNIQSSLINAIMGGDGGAGIASAIGTSLGNAIRNFDWIGLGNSINNLIVQGIKANLSAMNGIIRGALNIDLAAAGAQAIQSLLDGMKSKIAELLAWVKTIPSQIRAAVGNISIPVNVTTSGTKLPPGKSAATTQSLDGARAKGGPVTAGKSYLVGEDGAEVFSPSRSGFITPNNLLRQTAQSRAAMITNSSNSRSMGDVNVSAPITITGVSDPRAAAANAAAELGLKVRAAVSSLNSDWL